MSVGLSNMEVDSRKLEKNMATLGEPYMHRLDYKDYKTIIKIIKYFSVCKAPLFLQRVAIFFLKQ